LNYKITELTYSNGQIESNPIQGRPVNTNDIAMVIHVFYIDVWQEIAEYLTKVPFEYDLYITVPDQLDMTYIIDILNAFPDAHLYSVENRGRDVLPFLHMLNLIGTSNYKYLCKLHTKKSVEIDNGDAWRKLLYYDLIGSSSIAEDIIRRFEINETLGMITGKNLILNGAHFDLGNQSQLQNLADLAHVPFTRLRKEISFLGSLRLIASTKRNSSLSGIPIFLKLK
jgi:lipopolysaccharide biosynthesis protein